MADKPDMNYLKTYGVRASEWYAARNLERETNRKQKELIQAMGPNEAMIIYPIGESPPMLGLIEHADERAGKDHGHSTDKCTVDQKEGQDFQGGRHEVRGLNDVLLTEPDACHDIGADRCDEQSLK